MIITQTRKSRSFVGSMNPGADVIDALTQICIDNKIFCAQFSGVGYIRDPRIQTYNLKRLAFDPPSSETGTFHAVALHGNVSLRERQTVIRCHVIGTLHGESPEDPRLLTGELVGGQVVSLEFSLTTIDDIRLYRADDDRTGLDPWLHMDVGSGPPPADEESRDIPVLASAPGSAPPTGAGGAPRDGTGSADVEVRKGDRLDHPTLGSCQVVTDDHDDHVTIELESGRRVQLHLGLLTLEPAGKHADGGRIYKVSIRRRR